MVVVNSLSRKEKQYNKRLSNKQIRKRLQDDLQQYRGETER